MKKNTWMTKFLQALLLIGLTLSAGFSYAEEQLALSNKIESVDFSTLPGGRVAVHIKTTSPLANAPAGFTLNSPARIALDFPGVANGLAKNIIQVDQGSLKSIMLAQAKERTRMVLNLSKNVGYSSTVKGNEVTIMLQANEVSANVGVETKFAEAAIGQQQYSINNVDFARGKNGEGRIIVDLSNASAGINIKQTGKTIVVDFINTDVPANLQRRLNVTNFNTPVIYVDTMKQGKNGRMIIEPKGNWEQSAYQADKKFIIDVRQVIEDPNKLVRGAKPGYAGEKLSLNFQNIEVRSVLQVIADFTGLNIITSDTVTGNLTLRLKDVPWDQALDIIVQSKGLSMRKTGNVILIAPAEEVAAKEKQMLEASLQIDDLEPVRTEVFTLKYMKAESLKNILSDPKQKILSKRGSAVLDPRTNTVFVQDTSKYLEQVQAIINKVDIAVKQVMIESRLVIADDKYSKALGARFGVTQTGTPGRAASTISGTLGNRPTASTATTLTQGTHNGSIQTALTGGAVTTSSDGLPDLASNLPVANAFGSFAYSLFHLPAGLLLNFELTAMEADGRGKVVSSPRVTTANQHKAKIAQGTEIPYLEASSSGAATVSFKPAVLSLEVTPQITPDDKIIMQLDVKKDRVGQVFNGVPSIETQNINTLVLVGNGETAVLGGIFEQTERNDVEKVPFFGDLPIMGNLFKRKTTLNNKTELLIFITPKIMNDSLTLQ
ncbi:type IV pilus secretin PilQ [Methylotenera sp.]|uniref:type IV pilus secretin PilQ n=1 Tax=Methylotenera sp. TaxID=2051956 RepID=UPI00271B0FF9|nr:type IV pilus secretin PilQ [Methylotenera sp.]MDO9205396.1 type IV pilus secretin PilQ [Methylotenera sp.]MDP2070589.1 type IV pilus secretin PilQ [Methylotenera sp.]MDP3006189.1 type IV pilus secretin PilQ [Methylotenera sp.]